MRSEEHHQQQPKGEEVARLAIAELKNFGREVSYHLTAAENAARNIEHVPPHLEMAMGYLRDALMVAGLACEKLAAELPAEFDFEEADSILAE